MDCEINVYCWNMFLFLQCKFSDKYFIFLLPPESLGWEAGIKGHKKAINVESPKIKKKLLWRHIDAITFICLFGSSGSVFVLWWLTPISAIVMLLCNCTHHTKHTEEIMMMVNTEDEQRKRSLLWHSWANFIFFQFLNFESKYC